MRRGARRWRRRVDGDGIVVAVRRTEAKKMRPTPLSRAPRSDCWGEEEEGGAAVLLPRLDPLLVAGVDGGVRRRTARSRPWRSARVRVPAEREKGGGEEQVVEGVSFILQGGPGCEGSGGGGRGGARPWRQGFPCRHSDDADRGDPLSGPSPFSNFQNFQQMFVFN